MRVYGRVNNTGSWQVVQTDASGHNDEVYITAMCQSLLLNLNESPFWADWGIPAQQSVLTQAFPDFYVFLTQQRFSPYFANLQISKITNPTPTYKINVVTTQGVTITQEIPI